MLGFLTGRVSEKEKVESLIERLEGALRAARLIVEREARNETFDGGDVAWLTLHQIDHVLKAVELRKSGRESASQS